MNSIASWNFDDHKKFEVTMAEVGTDSPFSFEEIGQYMQKPLEEVLEGYNDLLYDINLIESGKVTVDYPEYTSPTSPVETSRIIEESEKKSGKKRGRPWTKEEHRGFLRGLKANNRGDWRTIARSYVKSRTSTQVASHAQKYFQRQEKLKTDKKRTSIHDLTSEGDCPLQPGLDSVSQPQNHQMPPPQYSNFQH